VPAQKTPSSKKKARRERQPATAAGGAAAGKAKIRLTDDQRTSFALAKFTPKSDGHLPTYEELAKKFGVRPNTLSKAVNHALAKGLVEIRRANRRPRKPTRKPALEEKLRKAFRITEAIVVDVGDHASSDMIHELLGHAMARSICDGQVIDDDETVGIGSGRAIYEMAQAVSCWGVQRAGVKLLSMSGLAYGHEPVERRVLDPDLNLATLAQGFDVAPVLMTVPRPLIIDDADERASTRDETHLGEEKWNELGPGVALVGLGVLAPGHRFFEAVKRNKIPPPLLKVENELRFLVDWSERVIEEYKRFAYSPVADICNRLFLVPLPPDAPELNEGSQRALACIESINACVLAVRWKQLLRVPKLILLAGSEIKALAIHHVLTHDTPRLRIRTLCTDSRTAEKLITLQHQTRRTESKANAQQASVSSS